MDLGLSNAGHDDGFTVSCDLAVQNRHLATQTEGPPRLTKFVFGPEENLPKRGRNNVVRYSNPVVFNAHSIDSRTIRGTRFMGDSQVDLRQDPTRFAGIQRISNEFPYC